MVWYAAGNAARHMVWLGHVIRELNVAMQCSNAVNMAYGVA